MIEIPGVEGCGRPGRTTRTTEDLNRSHLIRPPHPEKTPCCPAPLCCCSSASAPPPASRCCQRQLLPAGHDSPPTARVSPGSVPVRLYCSESGLLLWVWFTGTLKFVCHCFFLLFGGMLRSTFTQVLSLFSKYFFSGISYFYSTTSLKGMLHFLSHFSARFSHYKNT